MRPTPGSPEGRQSAGPHFAGLASGSCPSYGALLLALAAELGHVDADAAHDALDDQARPLFGLGRLDPGRRIQRVAAVLDRKIGYRPVPGAAEPGAFLLEEVVARRQGHPVLLAVVAHELARRAGAGVEIFSSPTGWYAGCADGDRRLALISLGSAQLSIGSHDLRRHCAHEVAYVVLCGLQHALRWRGEHHAADQVAALREHLPPSRFTPVFGHRAPHDGR